MEINKHWGNPALTVPFGESSLCGASPEQIGGTPQILHVPCGAMRVRAWLITSYQVSPKQVHYVLKSKRWYKELSTTKNTYKMHILIWSGLRHWSDIFQGLGVGEGNPKITLRLTGSYCEKNIWQRQRGKQRALMLPVRVLEPPWPLTISNTSPRIRWNTSLFQSMNQPPNPTSTTNDYICFLDFRLCAHVQCIQKFLNNIQHAFRKEVQLSGSIANRSQNRPCF